LYDAAGHRWSPATLPGFHQRLSPRNKGFAPPANNGAPSRLQLVRVAGSHRTRCDIVHTVEMTHKGVPLVVTQRQLQHANVGITSIYLQGIEARRSSAPSTRDRRP
jgi:hypothetical protein